MRAPVICLLLAVVGLAGCGEAAEPEAALPGVRLAVLSPRDTETTTSTSMTVTGTVRPAGATVLVDGEEADVSGGRFSHTVTLDGGTNIIDVEAGAPRRPAAMTAVRVVRQVPVEIPDVSGEDPDTAEQRLRGLGFEVEQERGGGLLDDLLGGDPGVCGSDPEAGDRALPGSTVTLDVRRNC